MTTAERARRRARLEFWSGVIAAVVGLITAVWSDWIELVFHWDPDHGSGWFEWAVAAAALAVFVVCTVLSRWELRRAAPAPAPVKNTA